MFSPWQTRNPKSWFQVIPNKNGFLPILPTLDKQVLPEYQIINEILDSMMLSNPNSLLALNKFAETRKPLLKFEGQENNQKLAKIFEIIALWHPLILWKHPITI